VQGKKCIQFDENVLLILVKTDLIEHKQASGKKNRDTSNLIYAQSSNHHLLITAKIPHKQ